MFPRDFRYKMALLIYWLIFAIFSAFSARSPGYVSHPESAPYPWMGLFVMLALLGLLVTLFYVVLLPPRFRTSYWRLPLALIFGVAMVATCELTFATDLPGLYYVPFFFSLATMLFLLVIAGGTVAGALWHKFRATP